MNTLRTILDLCLLRGRPQDLPTSKHLLWLSAGASVMVDVFSVPAGKLDVGHLLFLVLQVALFGAVVWGLLMARGFPARWIQTMTGLYSTNALFSLLLIPFLPALVEMVKQEPGSVLGWQAYVMLLLSGWFLAVMTRIMREATEWSLPLSLLASVACVALVRMLGLLLAPLFGFAVDT